MTTSLSHPKIYKLPELKQCLKVWRLLNDSIVFTNGCFDILHPGHCQYLIDAKKLGQRLVVGINTDASVKRQNKGVNRPINSEDFRAFLMANLHSVDAVCLFDGDTPLDLIKDLQPEILVKGADYNAEEKNESSKTYIVGSKEVNANGGKVQTIPLLDGYSSTSIIKKIQNLG